MGDVQAVVANQAAGGKSGKQLKLQTAPIEVTVHEFMPIAILGLGRVLKNQWVYVFHKGNVLAEIQATNASDWKIKYNPTQFKGKFIPEKTTQGVVVLEKSVAETTGYKFFVSPVRASARAIDHLKKNIAYIPKRVIDQKTPSDDAGRQIIQESDYYAWSEFIHDWLYVSRLIKYEAFVQNETRQSKLFIASVLKNWAADGDQASVKNCLKNPNGPSDVVEEYKRDEKKTRGQAEEGMKILGDLIFSPQHQAIEFSVLDGDNEALAISLFHWAHVSEGMLRLAVGRVVAKKLMEENKTVPAKILFGDTEDPNLPTVLDTFRKAHQAASIIVAELLAAKVRHLRASVGPGRKMRERVKLYLGQLGLKTTLQGNYKIIHDRLEAGVSITKNIRGAKKTRVIRFYEKLEWQAGSAIPEYDEKAKRMLDRADRLEKRGVAPAEAVGKSMQFLIELANFINAIEDYRAAFPDTKDKQLFTVMGAGADLYSAMADILEKYTAQKRLFGITGGAFGFVSGVWDMLDAEEQMVKSVMQNNDYAAAAGHTITAVGASMTAIAGGVLMAKAISGGALFGGPFGAVVGAIGAGLMALGMLVVTFFSDNEYQAFARHCFLGKNHGDVVKPYWSTVMFGGGSTQAEVAALYDLLYRYKVLFFKTVKVTRGLPSDTHEFSGYKVQIVPGYTETSKSKFVVDLDVYSPKLGRKMISAKGLTLPDSKTETWTDSKTKAPYFERRWRAHELFNMDEKQFYELKKENPVLSRFHLYPDDFTLSMQLSESEKNVGNPVRLKAKAGGQKTFGGHVIQGEWERVDFD